MTRLKVDSTGRFSTPRNFAAARRLFLAAPLMLVLGACDSAVTAPKAFNEERCQVPRVLAESVYTHAFPSTSLRPALQHAAGPMAS